jgi:fatty-acyl-CoA synthase
MSHIPGIGYWIEKAARLHPRREALVVPGEERTGYAGLAAGTRRAAALLRELGMGPGTRFGLLMWNDRRLLELLLAAGRIGAVAVPLNWRLTAAELAFQVGDAGIDVVFAGAEPRPLAAALAAESSIRLVEVPEAYDGAAADPGPDTAEALVGLPGGDAPALVVYTSGTSGRPKGVVLSHANLFWNALNAMVTVGLSFRDTTLTALPMTHVGGIGLFTLPSLLAGGRVVMLRSFSAEAVLEAIESERVTVFLGVPAMHRMIVESERFAASDLSSLRMVLNGGDRCPLALAAAWRERGVPFGGGYGLTESAPIAFLPEPDDFEASLTREAFIGRTAFFTDARVVRPDGSECAPEERGEIQLAGPNLFTEYLGLPEETAAAVRDGWFGTGDLAVRDAEGHAFIAGRSKQLIKSGGENIDPAEIEEVLLRHPGVLEACVVGREHERWTEVPFAVVALRRGASPSDDELREHCGRSLARFKVPVAFARVEEIPRTSIGKPDRAGIARLYRTADV